MTCNSALRCEITERKAPKSMEANVLACMVEDMSKWALASSPPRKRNMGKTKLEDLGEARVAVCQCHAIRTCASLEICH